MPPPVALRASSSDRPRLYWLDWLRFLAAFVVVIDHTRSFNWAKMTSYTMVAGSPTTTAFLLLCSTGHPAVLMFFVLGGWLVGGHAVERVRFGKFDAASYAADRLSRVYVPLIPALLFTAAVVQGLGYDTPFFERQTPHVRRWLRARLGGRPATVHLTPNGQPVLAAGV